VSPTVDRYVLATRTIERIESEFDVNTLRCGELLCWPVIRIALWHQIYRADAPIIQPRDVPVDHGPRRGPPPFSRDSYAPYLLDDAQVEREKDPYDAVFFTRDEEYTERLHGHRYNRFIDPVIERARRRWRCAKLQLTDDDPPASLSLHDPGLLLETQSFTAQRRALDAERGYPGPVSIERWGEFQAYMRSVLVDFELPESYFLWRVRRIDDNQAFFQRLLPLLGPRAMFTACWYQDVQMGMIRACRSLGIQSVDLMHGSQSPYHMAYDPWNRWPAGGYDTLPDVCWLWGPWPQRNHERAFGGRPGAPTSIVGGYPWLTPWVKGDFLPPTAAGWAFYAALARYRRSILVTWGNMTESPSDLLVEAMRRSPEDWIWLFRLHPLARANIPAMRAHLASRGVERVELDHASSLPLYGLLRRVSHHVTRLSTACFEALTLGVPSAIVDEVDLHRYDDHVKAGVFPMPRTADGLLDFITSEPIIPPLDPPLVYADVDPDAPDRALEAILGGGRSWPA
jgi:hypothetical protein